jgi:hypothetical protein
LGGTFGGFVAALIEDRAEHLLEVDVPMLVLRGTRDALADIGFARVSVLIKQF